MGVSACGPKRSAAGAAAGPCARPPVGRGPTTRAQRGPGFGRPRVRTRVQGCPWDPCGGVGSRARSQPNWLGARPTGGMGVRVGVVPPQGAQKRGNSPLQRRLGPATLRDHHEVFLSSFCASGARDDRGSANPSLNRSQDRGQVCLSRSSATLHVAASQPPVFHNSTNFNCIQLRLFNGSIVWRPRG